METALRFAKPEVVDPVTVAFGAAGELGKLLPPMDEIPAEFKRRENCFVALQRQWFFKGLDTSVLRPKPGIDKTRALDHLAAIQGSFEPSHEHKSAGVAYLMSLWFEQPSADLPKGHRPKGSNKRK